MKLNDVFRDRSPPNNKKGYFALAHGGTLFLDELSEMPLSMQVKLLRVLEDKEFYPLGGTETVNVDIRVKYLRHSRRLEICEPLKAVEKPWATSKVAAIYLKKFS